MKENIKLMKSSDELRVIAEINEIKNIFFKQV